MALNSLCVTAGRLCWLSMVLGLASSDSIDDQRLMFEGKINKLCHELCNIQFVIEEYSNDASFQLCDKGDKFLTVPPADADHSYEGDEPNGETDSESSGEKGNEVELLCHSVMNIIREKDSLHEELEAIRQQLEIKKARVKELWRMSCEQVAGHDAMSISKDEEIARLKAQSAEQVCQRSPTSPNTESLPVSHNGQQREARHMGKPHL